MLRRGFGCVPGTSQVSSEPEQQKLCLVPDSLSRKIRVDPCPSVVESSTMTLTGIGDEAGNTIDTQIAATKALGWKTIEARGVEAPGFPKANIHDIPDKAFDLVERKLKDNGIGVHCF